MGVSRGLYRHGGEEGALSERWLEALVHSVIRKVVSYLSCAERLMWQQAAEVYWTIKDGAPGMLFYPALFYI